MASVLKIDGTDFWRYLRVAPDDGFDPLDSDFREPQFGDAVGGIGNPLLGISDNNRELVWPVHFSPKFSGGAYPSTKDGLHTLLADMNEILNNAKVLEYQDEASTKSTFYKIKFARFEPQYNFRRGQVLVASGTVRLFVETYGTTGTMVSLGTAQGTGPVLALNVGSFAGDQPAYIRAWVEHKMVNVQTLNPGSIYGLSVVPSGYSYDIPAPSMVLAHPSALLIAPANAASTTTGSTIIYLDQQVSQRGLNMGPIVKVGFSNASTYMGRNRVFALVAPGGDFYMRAYNNTDGKPFQPKVLATGLGVTAAASLLMTGFNLVDLGVWNVPKTSLASPGVPTVGFSVNVDPTDYRSNNPLGWNGGFGLNRLFIFPEDNTIIGHNYTRRLLAYDKGAYYSGQTATVTAANVDAMGNPYVEVDDIATIPLVQDGNSLMMNIGGFTGSYSVAALKIGHATVNDLLGEINVANGPISMGSGYAFTVGKYTGTGAAFSARFHGTGGGAGVFSIVYGGVGGPGFGAPVTIASQQVASTSIGEWIMSFTNTGPLVQAILRHPYGSVIATLSGSHADAVWGGQGLIGTSGSGPIAPDIYGFTFSDCGSNTAATTALFVSNNRENYTQGLNTTVNAHVYDYQPQAQGVLARVRPYDNIVGFESSLDNAPSIRALWNIGAHIEEAFTYSR